MQRFNTWDEILVELTNSIALYKRTDSRDFEVSNLVAKMYKLTTDQSSWLNKF
jgi:hypothetical protein